METINKLHWRTKNLVGERFGKLLVIELVGYGFPGLSRRGSFWLCKCDCGKEVIKSGNDLLNKKIRSCSIGCGHRLDFGEAAFNALYDNYVRNAKNREFVFELSKEQADVLFKSPCYYCGIEPKQEVEGKYGSYFYNGIDRVDNNKGYVLDNIVPCCKTCNYGKHSMNEAEWYDYRKRLCLNFIKDNPDVVKALINF